MEGLIHFVSENNTLTGMLSEGNNGKGVVITHPHPLYGGDMHDAVVECISRSYERKGHTTLRFNFRGVGGSEGRYTDGVGEQEDVRAAVGTLKDRGLHRIALAGYSFGAWVNALVGCSDLGGQEMVMVSPPVALLDFRAVRSLPCLRLVIIGSRDDIAPVDRIKKRTSQWNPLARIEIIAGADHFYSGNLKGLETVLSESI